LQDFIDAVPVRKVIMAPDTPFFASDDATSLASLVTIQMKDPSASIASSYHSVNCKMGVSDAGTPYSLLLSKFAHQFSKVSLLLLSEAEVSGETPCGAVSDMLKVRGRTEHKGLSQKTRHLSYSYDPSIIILTFSLYHR
jgi:hypothetical protein